MYNYPIMRPGLFAKGLSLTKSINWGGLLDGTQKTLGVINQAIPIIYQVKPVFSNAKTMFKIAGELRSSDKKSTTSTSELSISDTPSTPIDKPIFYI